MNPGSFHEPESAYFYWPISLVRILYKESQFDTELLDRVQKLDISLAQTPELDLVSILIAIFLEVSWINPLRMMNLCL